MNIVWKNNRSFILDNARLIYCNFAGAAGKFNAEGKRNFSVIIDDPDVAQELMKNNIRLKLMKKRDESDPDIWTMKVNVNFGSDYPPKIKSISSKKIEKLGENNVKELDKRGIVKSAKLELNMYAYSDQQLGMTMNSLYLNAMKAYLNDDWFDDDDEFEEQQEPLYDMIGMPIERGPEDEDVPF